MSLKAPTVGVTNLPTDAQCAVMALSDSVPEIRPANTTANHEMPTSAWLATFHTAVAGDPQTAGAPTSVTDRIDGQFAGTTDQILKWGACKWGFDENEVRGDAVIETNWVQAGEGDVGNGNSFGILQAKSRDSASTCPTEATSQNLADANLPDCQLHLSTAFAVDYALGMQYATYIGQQNYLATRAPMAGYPTFPNGTQAQMMFGALAYWNTGTWYNAQGIAYANQVYGYANTSQPWRSASFLRHRNFIPFAAMLARHHRRRVQHRGMARQ
jgi:autotransporter family porin